MLLSRWHLSLGGVTALAIPAGATFESGSRDRHSGVPEVATISGMAKTHVLHPARTTIPVGISPNDGWWQNY